MVQRSEIGGKMRFLVDHCRRYSGPLQWSNGPKIGASGRLDTGGPLSERFVSGPSGPRAQFLSINSRALFDEA